MAGSRRLKRQLAGVALASVVGAATLTTFAGSALGTVHSPPWADIFGSQWGDLNTVTAATNFKNALSGSYSKFLNLNSKASIAMGASYAQGDAIWATFGHGGPGFITYCNPALGATCTSVLRANGELGPCSGGNGDDCLSDYGTLLHQIKLMVFAGCETARTPTGKSASANLQIQAVSNRGVDSTLAWWDLIYFGGQTGEKWAARFPVYANSGWSVEASADAAADDVKNANFGNGWGWDSWMILQQYSDVTIIPAGYGT